MLATLLPGIGLERRLTIGADRCIAFMGAEAQVYATPWMVSDVEYACLDAIAPHLDAGESSVGVQVHIDHVGATPPGMEVRIDVRVVRVERRRVAFEFTVHDDVELVGRGTHARFVVDVDRTVARLRDKRRLAPPASTG
jgi:fluoroacetyl-CoA thioesterase